MVEQLLAPEERVAGVAVLAEGFRQRLAAQQQRPVHRVAGSSEGGRHQVGGGFCFAGVAGAVAQAVAAVEADRLGHLHDQDAVPQTSLAHE